MYKNKRLNFAGDYDPRKLTEQHTLVNLVAPFLLALDWTDNRLIYQYFNADAGFFNSKGCFRIMEVKPFANPLTKCIQEAIMHAQQIKVKEIVCTNGKQFLLLKRDDYTKYWYLSSCLNVVNFYKTIILLNAYEC